MKPSAVEDRDSYRQSLRGRQMNRRQFRRKRSLKPRSSMNRAVLKGRRR